MVQVREPMRTSVLSLVLVAATSALACSSSPGAPSSPAPSAPASPGGGGDGTTSGADPSAPPASPDGGAPGASAPTSDAGAPAPDAAPPPVQPRDCGVHHTAALPLARHVLHPAARPVFLGEGVADSGPNGVAYAVENPLRQFTGATGGSSAGPDADADGLTSTLDLKGGDDVDTFVDHDAQGNNPLAQWAAAVGTTSMRANYVMAAGTRESSWNVAQPEQKAPSAPSDTSARYVRNFEAHRYVAFALVVDYPSQCTQDALHDIAASATSLGNLDSSTGKPLGNGGMLDPALRAAVQQVLVRDGVQLTLTVISNRAWPSGEAVVQSTACGADNLAACADALGALSSAFNDYTAGVQSSDYNALKAGTDPYWDITSFGTGIVLYLN